MDDGFWESRRRCLLLIYDRPMRLAGQDAQRHRPARHRYDTCKKFRRPIAATGTSMRLAYAFKTFQKLKYLQILYMPGHKNVPDQSSNGHTLVAGQTDMHDLLENQTPYRGTFGYGK